MLDMQEALKAKQVLDNWLEENKRAAMTSEEAETVEAIMTSPVGSVACHNLRNVLWLVRDLIRCGYGKMPEHLQPDDVEATLVKLDEHCEREGLTLLAGHRQTAAAMLKGPIGLRISSNVARLHAAVHLMWQIRTAAKKDGAK